MPTMPILPHLLGNSAPSVLSDTSTAGVIAEIFAEVGNAEAHGYTAEHDDRHDLYTILRAAAAYQCSAASCGEDDDEVMGLVTEAERLWPFEPEDFNPSENPERNLIKAAGLLVSTVKMLRRAREAAAPATTELSHGQTPTDTDGEEAYPAQAVS